MDQESKKVPIYNRSWVWILSGLLIIALLGGGNNNTKEASSKQIAEKEAKDQQVDEINIDDVMEQNDNDNRNSEEAIIDIDDEKQNIDLEDDNELDNDVDNEIKTPVDEEGVIHLSIGRFKVGVDVLPGKYVITGEGSGNLQISNRAGIPYVNELLDEDMGVLSVTLIIEEGHFIDISGLNNVTFTPVESALYTSSLTTGTWVVGIDFMPGIYEVYSSNGNGKLFIYNNEEWPIVNTIINEENEDKLLVELEEGFTIKITGINTVEFLIIEEEPSEEEKF